jgi:hypothetical protein
MSIQEAVDLIPRCSNGQILTARCIDGEQGVTTRVSRSAQLGVWSPLRVTATRRSTAALEGMLLAARRACRQ